MPPPVAVQQWRNINLNPNRHPSCPPFAHSLLYLPLSSIARTSGTDDGASLSWRPARRAPLFIREFLLRHSVPGLLRASYLFMPLSSLGPLSSALIRPTQSFFILRPLWILSALESFRRDNGRQVKQGIK